MKHLWKRSLALFLSLVFLFSLAPAPAYAEDPAEEEKAGVIELAPAEPDPAPEELLAPAEPEAPEEPLAPAEPDVPEAESAPAEPEALSDPVLPGDGTVIASGRCGAQVYWRIEDDGTLYLSGTGKTYDFSDYDEDDDLVWDPADWYAYKDSVVSLVIEEGVTETGIYAFCSMDHLSSVSFPSTLTKMGGYSFRSCTALTSVSFPASVAQIPGSCFSYCSSLESVTIPEGVTQIGSAAFSSCTALHSVDFPESLTWIGSNAFTRCTALESVAVPDGVSRISGYTFQYCTALTTVSLPAGLTNIDSFAFNGCNAMTSVSIPSLEDWFAITFSHSSSNPLNNSAADAVLIAGGEEIRHLVIPASVTEVKKYAFYSCGGLLSVTGNGLTAIGEAAFERCANLASVEVGGTGLQIGAWAFAYNPALESVVLTEGTNGILKNVFDHCTALTTLALPASLKSIQADAFAACSALERVELSDLGAWCGVSIGNGNTWYANPLSNGPALYVNGQLMTDLVIPEGVTAINPFAFYGLNGIASVTLPEGLTSVSNYAFYCCGDLRTVFLPASLKSLGSVPFSSQYGLDVYIPDLAAWCAVKFSESTSNPLNSNSMGLDGRLFVNNQLVTDLVIPDSVTQIEKYAFCGCASITSITLPASMTSISNSAFYGCRGLTELVLPETVVQIGDYAFGACSNLQTVTLPASVTSVGNYAFYYCGNLKNIYFEGDSPSFASYAFDSLTATVYYNRFGSGWPSKINSQYGGKITWRDYAPAYLLVASGRCGDYISWSVLTDGRLSLIGSGSMWNFAPGEAPWYAYRDEFSALEMSANINVIGENAFYDCPNLTSAALPENLTAISAAAFAGCTGLDSLSIPERVSTIGDSAFSGCTALSLTKLPNSLTTLGESAFSGCVSLAWDGLSLPTGLTAISAHAFEGCTGILSLTLPANMRTIGDSAFASCTGLVSLTIPENLSTIGDSAFFGCTALSLTKLPNSLTTLGEYAFSGCVSLAWDGLSLPTGLTQISVHAFEGCTGILSLTMPTDLEILGDSAFASCTGLTAVGLSEGLVSVGNSAFSGCTALVTAVLPESLTELGEYAFYNCAKLSWSNISLPANLSVVSAHAFDGCTRITSLILPEGILSVGEGAFRRTGISSVILPESLTAIGDYAFQSTARLESIELPENLQELGMGAFSGCTKLAEITVPSGVTVLKEDVFRRCGLTRVSLQHSLQRVEANAFNGCSKLTDVYYGGTEADWAQVTVLAGNDPLTAASFHYPEIYPIGSNAAGDNVYASLDTALGILRIYGSGEMRGSFYSSRPWSQYNDVITSVVVENGITNLGEYVFMDLANLNSVRLPESVQTIGRGAFYGCDGLPSITLPQNITAIHDDLFHNCGGLEEITIPDGVVSIGANAFYNCGSLRKIVIPPSVASIGDHAFYCCSGVTEVHIRDLASWCEVSNTNEDNIYSSLFYNEAAGLYLNGELVEDLVIPDGVEEINSWAFRMYRGLRSLVIPESVTAIQDLSFYSCTNLSSVTIPGSVTGIGKNAFNECGSLRSLTIPEGVTDIGDYAFYGCPLTMLELPSTLLEVGAGFASPERLRFNDTAEVWLTIIGIQENNGSFRGTQFTFTDRQETAWWCGEQVFAYLNGDGVLSLEGEGPMWEYGYNPNAALRQTGSPWENSTLFTDVVISEGVTSVGSGTFYLCSNLHSVLIPAGLTTIGDGAFRYCSGLTEVILPTGLTSIGKDAFRDCTGLTGMAFPEGLADIGETAFYACSSLTDVSFPTGLSSIGECAFGCSGLTGAVLPAGLSSLGAAAFYDCGDLTEITIPESLVSIPNAAFSGCSSLYAVHYEGTVAQWQQVTVGDYNDALLLAHIFCTDGVLAASHSLTRHEEIPASCTESGIREYYQCEICDKLFADSEAAEELTEEELVLPALGHDWAEPTYVWAEDYGSVTASRVCRRDGTHMETETAYSLEEITREPGCEEPGETTYTAWFENEGFAEQTVSVDNIPAIGHDWTEPTYTWAEDNSRVTARRQCRNDPDHEELEEVFTTAEITKPATCEEYGETTYTVSFENPAFEPQTKTLVNIDPIGHNWGEPTYAWAEDYGSVTAARVCAHDASHVESETAYTFEEITREPSCEEPGETTYTAWFENEAFAEQSVSLDNIDPIGHAWGEPSYTWAEDNSRVTARRVCRNDPNHEELEEVFTSSEITKPATCEVWGETTYTVSFENPAFEPQTKTVVNIEPLGHDWSEPTYTWAEDNSAVTATRTCAHDAAHVETETVNTVSEITKPATCEDSGETTYTVSFENPAFEPQTKTVVNIEPLGHDWGEPSYTWAEDDSAVTATRTCAHDAAHVETETVNTAAEVTKPATCEEWGETTYTVSFENPAFEPQTKTVVNVEPLGHEWGEPSYTWAEDDSAVTAARTCAHDAAHVETETVNTVSEITKPATCEDWGETTYTVSFENPAFEPQTKTVVNIEPLGHDWSEPVWTWTGYESATAAFTCKRDAEHTKTLDAVITVEVIEPTTHEEGLRTYTARVELDGTIYEDVRTETIPQLLAPPEILAQPQSAQADEGTLAVFAVEASGGELSYQWQWSADGGKTWKNSSSATVGYNEATLQVAAAASRNGYRYRCVISNSEGSVTSEAATLTVITKPAITAQPESVSAAEQATVKFSVKATGGELSYQWQWSKDGKTWKNSSSATVGYNTDTLQVQAALSRSGYRYRCRVSNRLGEVTSSVATLTVIEIPVITVQPESVTVEEGETARFTVSAQGTGLSYQWQWSKDGKTWNNSSSATVGYNTATLQVTASESRNGYQYRCKVTNSKGTATSEPATLTVNGKPVITAQPESVTAGVGGTVTFTVSAQGTGLSYQWQWSRDGKTWNNSSSATVGYNTATLQVTASESRNGYQYRCKVTNSKGTAISEPATLTVSGKPVITAQPQNVTAAVGGTVKFTVSAQGTGLSYQWQWSRDGKTWNNSSSATAGYNTATLQVTASESRNGYRYRCKVTNSKGTAISEPATLTVSGKPVITAQPQSVTAAVGETAEFTVAASGSNLSYQWQWRAGESGTWANSSRDGNKTATLSVLATAARNGQQYRCVITNSGGTVYSAPATLTVTAGNALTAQPFSFRTPCAA